MAPVTARNGAGRPTAEASPLVITLTVNDAASVAHILHALYPHAQLTIDKAANAIIVTASPDEAAQMRQIATQIDAKNPLSPQTQAFALHRIRPQDAIVRLHSLFPADRFTLVPPRSFVVSGTGPDLQQIQSLVNVIDAPPASPTPAAAATPPDSEAVRILSASPKQVAHDVAGTVHGLRVAVAGQSIVLSGAPDLIQRAKDVIAVLDAPPAATRYTAVYRIKTLDAKSVADLLERSFPDAKITVDEDINALSVYATASEQRRISDGIAQLDTAGPTTAGGTSGISAGSGTGPAQLYTLKYALPGQSGAPSTSAGDLATTVTQTLASQAPDLHITAAPNNAQLIITGSPYSVRLAQDLIKQLDVPQRLVVLDTEILEVDENTAKNLGLQLSSITGGSFGFGTVFSEVQPTPDPITGIAPPLKRLQPLTRTAIGFIAQLNLAIEHGTARVLADPRITTLSGHTATIRAGDNISIPLTTGGGAGTIATTQIQTFQTGVSLDITPIVNDDGLITVALHPVVNSLTGILNGVPQISTRDTQTTVALRQNDTLMIGGLIQDNTQRTESKIPVLGDLPLVGRIFRNETLNGDRNELIISVTPHVVVPGENAVYPGPPLPQIPTPAPLPTLPPGTFLPTEGAAPMATPSSLTLRTPPPPPPLLGVPATAATALPAPMSTTSAALSALTSPTANPTPSSAFTQGTTFTFGSPPPNNAAGPGDAVRIYYATATPMVLSYGKPLTIFVITSSNVTQLTLAYNGVSLTVPQTGPGQWQGTIPFTLVGNPARGGNIALSLVAARADGTQAMIPVPVTILGP